MAGFEYEQAQQVAKTFEDAFGRASEIEGIHVCSIDDIIRSKEASGRQKDRESLPRLRAFREWLATQGGRDRSSSSE